MVNHLISSSFSAKSLSTDPFVGVQYATATAQFNSNSTDTQRNAPILDKESVFQMDFANLSEVVPAANAFIAVTEFQTGHSVPAAGH